MSTDASNHSGDPKTTALPSDGTANSNVPGKRFTKRSWITLSASAGAFIVAAAIAVPVLSSNVAHAQAIDALTTSETELADAHTSLVSAFKDLAGANEAAAATYAESGEFVKVARKDLLADPTTLEELASAREDLVEAAELTVDGDVATAPTVPAAPALPVQDTPASMDAIVEQTQANDGLAEQIERDAKKAQKAADTITAQDDSVVQLTEQVVASGAEYGAAARGLDKAKPSVLEALKKAIAAMKDKKTPAVGRFVVFSSAYNAAKKSHVDTVAAEKVPGADVPEDQGGTAPSNPGSSKPDAGSGNTDTKPNTGTTRPGTGSKPAAPAPAPKPAAPAPKPVAPKPVAPKPAAPAPKPVAPKPPAPAPAPPKVPAKFETGAGYIPFGQCDGSFYSSHQVGWGGTSLGGRTLASKGVPWSATVNGDTVTYYIC